MNNNIKESDFNITDNTTNKIVSDKKCGYILTCCSTADMPKSYLDGRGIPYVCFHYIIDGKVYPDDLGVTVSTEEFYDMIDNGALPTTSQVNCDEFTEFFEEYIKQGLDIIHLSMSTGISGACNSARIAAENLTEKYPDRKITVIDTLCASSGYGLLLDMAADKRDSGMKYGELAKWIEDNKRTVHHLFFATDLFHLKRGGRLSASAAIAGTMLKICPLMHVNNEGKLAAVEKIRTKNKVIARTVEKVRATVKDGEAYSGKCFISHSRCIDDANKLAEMINESLPNMSEPVKIFDIGTVIGSHTGIGTCVVFFVGSDDRCDDLR